MSEEKTNEVKNEEVKPQETNEEKNPQEEKQTFTLDEVKNLLTAKNHEKEARKTAEAELKTLKEEMAKLKGEDSVSKFKEDEFKKIQDELNELKKEKEALENLNKVNALKDELRKIPGLNAAAIDDITDKAVKRGFTKSELGFYLDKNGKTIEDFTKDMKENFSYYFGLSSNKNIVNQELKTAIEKAKKSGSTMEIIKQGFKNYDIRNLK